MHIKNCRFTVDGAETYIVESKLLKNGQQGLFARNRITKDTIINWYTGENFLTFSEIEVRMNSHDKSSEYVMDVASNGDIVYHIDGYITPEEASQGKKRSLATYINHSRGNANVEFQYFRRADAFLQSCIGVVALRTIQADEELLVYYGDVYHQSLIDDGILV